MWGLDRFKAYRQSKRANVPSVDKRLPFIKALDNHNVLCQDGIFQTVSLAGVCPDSFSAEDLRAFKDQRNNALRGVLDTDLVFYYHYVRDRACPVPADTFDNPVAESIDREWRGKLAQTSWQDSLYVSFYAPLGVVKHLGRDEAYASMLARLDSTVELFLKQFSRYGPTRLEVDDGDGHSPLLRFLFRLVNYENRERIAPPQLDDIARLVSPYTTYFVRSTFEIDTSKEIRLGKMLGIREYSETTAPLMLEAVCGLDCSFVMTEIFQPMSPGIALERFDIQLKRRENLDDDAKTQTGQITTAKDQLAGGSVRYGHHQLSFTITADTYESLTAHTQNAMAAFEHVGMTAKPEDWWSLELAYWSQFPGNAHYVARPAPISTLNLSSLCAFHRRAVGELEGHKWGRALTTINTFSGTQYHFDWHKGETGNTVVTGKTGSGKTLLTMFLVLQSLRNGTRSFILDKDRGMQIPVEAAGGQYYVIEPGVPFMNPFSLPLNDTNKNFLKEFIQLLAGDCSSAEVNLINEIINELYELPAELRTLSHVASQARGHSREDNNLYERLRKWVGDGQYAWLFDNQNTIDTGVEINAIDLTSVLVNESIKRQVVFLLFHLAEISMDGTPFNFVVDEGWQALDHEITAYKIKDADKTIRKNNGAFIFLTQDPEDIINSSIGPAIVHQTQTFISFPHHNASEAHVELGFLKSDVEMLRMLSPDLRCFLLRKDDLGLVGQLDLSGCDFTLDVLECNTELRNLADKAKGIDDTNWFDIYRTLKHRGERHAA